LGSTYTSPMTLGEKATLTITAYVTILIAQAIPYSHTANILYNIVTMLTAPGEFNLRSLYSKDRGYIE
jgi:hypothetical protein